MQTSLPEEVADRMKALLSDYNAVPKKTLDDILIFTCALSVSTHFKIEKRAALDGLSCSRNVSNTTSFRLS